MRSTLVITLILLVAAFAVAQEPTSPSAPGQSPTQTQNPTMPDQARTPAPPAAAGDVIEGCLGGSHPNYTVTDKSGTAYQLQIPEGADASVLAKHIGESVAVQGTVDSAGTSSKADSTAGAAAAGAHTIKVVRIGKGSSSCPGSGNATKPPAK